MKMSCLKKLEEKGFLCSVNIATWSEKMDLLAVGFSSGEFSLFRLSWHKVWHCNAPSPNCGAVTSISWRVSDSRVIAVAFEKTSQIVIVDINSSHCVHRLMLTEIPNSVYFGCLGSTKVSDYRGSSEVNVFLPPLPNLKKNLAPDALIYHEGIIENAKILQNQLNRQSYDDKYSELDVLIVIQESFIYFYSCCLYPIFKIPITDVGKILKINLPSKHFPFLGVCAVINHTLITDLYKLDNITNNFPLIIDESNHIYNIISCFDYISTCVQAMLDSWQDALGEVQLKLARFSLEKRSPGTVGDEFLMLLLFGKPSSELLNFLVNELTSKGCENLQHSITSSYSILSTFTANNILPASRAMLFHAQSLYKICRKTSIIESDKSLVVMHLLKSAASLALKANEMLVVMEKSQIELKSFFKWLHCMLLKLSDENVPPGLNQTSQHELVEIANFIKESLNETIYDEDTPEGKKRRAIFRLEKVGQYLSKDHLKEPCDFKKHGNMTNHWLNCFINGDFENENIIYDPCTNKSLRQVLSDLEEIISAEISSVFCTDAVDAVEKLETIVLDKKFPYNEKCSNFFDSLVHENYLNIAFSDNKLINTMKVCYLAEDEGNMPKKLTRVIEMQTNTYDSVEVTSVRFMESKLCMLLHEFGDRSAYRLVLTDPFSDSSKKCSKSLFKKAPNEEEHFKRFPLFDSVHRLNIMNHVSS